MQTVSAIAADYLETDRKLLWALCYRMTGNAADADDIVQDTFVRAIEKPPGRLNEPLKPWLIRVAINLSRDLLRRRKRRGYTGEWLPSPIPTNEWELPGSGGAVADSPSARYEMTESISFAFLLALEALSPSQRAVLLLRDVFDYSTEETAATVGMTESNVKVTLHRARSRMSEYDKNRSIPTSSISEKTKIALDRFLACLWHGDIAGLEALLAEDVVSLSDGGGVVAAAMVAIRGRGRVLRLVTGLYNKTVGIMDVEFGNINGLPAAFFRSRIQRKGFASQFSFQCELDNEGRIKRLYTVLAPEKLTALR